MTREKRPILGISFDYCFCYLDVEVQIELRNVSPRAKRIDVAISRLQPESAVELLCDRNPMAKTCHGASGYEGEAGITTKMVG